MSKKKIIGECHLCGKIKPLSFEHIPPEKAFNDKRIKAYSFEQLIGNKKGYKTFQHGFGDYTLCELCNNNTGSWYARAYIDFVHHELQHIQGISDDEFSIYPLRVFKQILTMFFTVNYAKFREMYSWLSDYLLNKDDVNFLGGLKLYAYYVEDMRSTRISLGVVGILNTKTNQTACFSEFAYPPLGYILAYDDTVLDERLVDITFFSEYSYDQQATISLGIKALPIANTLFGEFRTAEEIERSNNEQSNS